MKEYENPGFSLKEALYLKEEVLDEKRWENGYGFDDERFS